MLSHGMSMRHLRRTTSDDDDSGTTGAASGRDASASTTRRDDCGGRDYCGQARRLWRVRARPSGGSNQEISAPKAASEPSASLNQEMGLLLGLCYTCGLSRLARGEISGHQPLIHVWMASDMPKVTCDFCSQRQRIWIGMFDVVMVATKSEEHLKHLLGYWNTTGPRTHGGELRGWVPWRIERR